MVSSKFLTFNDLGRSSHHPIHSGDRESPCLNPITANKTGKGLRLHQLALKWWEWHQWIYFLHFKQDNFFSVTEKSSIHPDPSLFKIILGLQHFLVTNSFMGNAFQLNKKKFLTSITIMTSRMPVLVFIKYTLKWKIMWWSTFISSSFTCTFRLYLGTKRCWQSCRKPMLVNCKSQRIWTNWKFEILIFEDF